MRSLLKRVMEGKTQMILSNSTKSVVLIVEDDATTANDLMVEYKKAGDEVIVCTDPLQATAIASHELPSLIIISVGLKNTDGFLLALDMRGLTELQDIPIVFITPDSGCTEVARLAFTIGAVDVISKPIQPSDVKEMVQHTSLSKSICQLKHLAQRLSERKSK